MKAYIGHIKYNLAGFGILVLLEIKLKMPKKDKIEKTLEKLQNAWTTWKSLHE